MILAWCYCFIEKDFKFQITNWRFDRNLGETYFRFFFSRKPSSFSHKKSYFHTKIKLSTNNIFSQKIITKVTHLGRYLSRKLFYYVSFCISTTCLHCLINRKRKLIDYDLLSSGLKLIVSRQQKKTKNWTKITNKT